MFVERATGDLVTIDHEIRAQSRTITGSDVNRFVIVTRVMHPDTDDYRGGVVISTIQDHPQNNTHVVILDDDARIRMIRELGGTP